MNTYRKYSLSRSQRIRRPTREINIGHIPLGGNQPIRIQSMTTTDTMDTAATVSQTKRLVDVGCEYVRITAPNIRSAKNLAVIQKQLSQDGYSVPLIADIHYTPKAALVAARIVEKVRINPGNYVDKKKFEQHDYTDAEYSAELDRLYKGFTPLIQVCKEYGTAMRIGVNHGSLSDRILSRYGDTPEGMVAAALEFVTICEAESYYQLVLSMKASNPLVMVRAYRLLAHELDHKHRAYPLHLGVTEAGAGEDGRIKSAVGIGTLLQDGLGDTIRVSLTEDPEREIPVARSLVNLIVESQSVNPNMVGLEDSEPPPGFFQYQRRETLRVLDVGGGEVPRVVGEFCGSKGNPLDLKSFGYRYISDLDKWQTADLAVDYLFTDIDLAKSVLPANLAILKKSSGASPDSDSKYVPVITTSDALGQKPAAEKPLWIMTCPEEVTDLDFDRIPHSVLVLDAGQPPFFHRARLAIEELTRQGSHHPIVLRTTINVKTAELSLLQCAGEIGGLLVDGLLDGLWINGPADFLSLSFGLLQATRSRISRTEFISCPSCGRTLFDLQETSSRIRARTNHLPGLKIGIMGCIVNGPGEMADADYGYVGSGVGRISLYRGQSVVHRNIPEKDAVEKLVNLIREDGKWVNPPDSH